MSTWESRKFNFNSYMFFYVCLCAFFALSYFFQMFFFQLFFNSLNFKVTPEYRLYELLLCCMLCNKHCFENDFFFLLLPMLMLVLEFPMTWWLGAEANIYHTYTVLFTPKNQTLNDKAIAKGEAIKSVKKYQTNQMFENEKIKNIIHTHT